MLRSWVQPRSLVMSRKDEMNSESNCIEAIFLSYINSKSSNNISLFFEGKDDFKYYCPRIFFNNNKEYNLYICDNKNNVIKVHNMIKKQSSSKSNDINLFFVDKDYDDNSLIDTDIYITPTYSIENLYFTDIAIKNMLKGVIGLSNHLDDDNKDLNNVFNYVTKYRDELIENIIYGNAYYSCQVRKSADEGIEKPNLSAIKQYCDLITCKTRQDFENLIENHVDISEEELNEECDRLRQNPLMLIRGKYIVEGMIECINFIVDDSNKRNRCGTELLSKRRLVRLNITKNNFISEFSNYAITPSCLFKYINDRILTR